jgi:hypothetical protein
MELINAPQLTLIDLPPEIHYLICDKLATIDKFNFAISAVTIYNSIDVDKISHMIKMGPTINQIKSIIYEINEYIFGSIIQSSERKIGEQTTQYIRRIYLGKNNRYKSKSFAGQLDCFTDGISELKNNCDRIPMTGYSVPYQTTQIYSLYEARKCIVDWSTCTEGSCVVYQIIDNNLLKNKKYNTYFR